MTTLISVYNSDGCQGRCDAKCYDAQGETCNCICGGKNHGAGLKQAIENTREMVLGETGAERLKEFLAENNLDASTARLDFPNEVTQYSIFDLPELTDAAGKH